MNLPPYPVFPELSQQRILMRQVQDQDLPVLKLISFYDGIAARDVAEAKAMQSRIDQDYELGNSVHWCIVDRATGELLGTCGYYRGFADGMGELGCVLLDAAKGKGYMSEALELAIAFGFGQIGLSKIVAITSASNLKASGLLERLNFTKAEEQSSETIRYELMRAEA